MARRDVVVAVLVVAGSLGAYFYQSRDRAQGDTPAGGAAGEAHGERFVGGIMKDAHSQRICPEVVVGDNIYRGDYVQFAKRFAVGVYSRGIHHSLAFKLSEYLAAGLCIVSPPFLHELPVPLEAHRHYLPYATLEECVRQCEVLLKDPAKARQMSAENRAYYRQWVEPSAHALDLLKRTFSLP